MNKDYLFRKIGDASAKLDGKAIMVQTGSENAIIPTAEIKYVEADDNRVKIITTTNEYSVRMTIKDTKSKLPQSCFVQTHRSYIVNLAHIRVFDKNIAFFDSTHKAFISRRKRKAFIFALNEYLEK